MSGPGFSFSMNSRAKSAPVELLDTGTPPTPASSSAAAVAAPVAQTVQSGSQESSEMPACEHRVAKVSTAVILEKMTWEKTPGASGIFSHWVHFNS